MIDARFRPLQTQPGTPFRQRRDGRSVFRASFTRTLDLLEKELKHLTASGIVIEAYFRLEQIRNDGWPYGKAIPSAPGVILRFDSRHGPLAISCDRFIDWQHNLRAIAMHLEHLRMATIYGVGQSGEHYKGWKQLPAPSVTPAVDLALAANRVAQIDISPEEVLADAAKYSKAYRLAAMRAHPDQRPDGSRDLWDELQVAKCVLDAHHGL